MDISFLAALLTYLVVVAVTPGPNNILAMNACLNYGMRGSNRLLLGIFSGFFMVQLLCGAFSILLAAGLPRIMDVLRYVGCGYILWLAYHVALSRPAESGEESGTLSFWKGFGLQFANVKTILCGLTAFTGYILPQGFSGWQVLAFVLLITFIGNGGTFIWAAAGAAFSSFLKRYWRITNFIMALMLVYSALHLI